MALSLSQFRANVTDLARPNRFHVIIGDPSNDILTYGNDNQVSLAPWEQSHEFLIKTGSLPGRTIGNVEVNWQGMKYNIAGDPTFDDITFTMHNNYEWNARVFWETWIQKIAEMETNERSQPGAYKSDVITLEQLGRTESDILATYKIFGAYPTTLNAIDLSMDNADQVEELSITLKVDYWEYQAGNQ
jgi:hypothetical protein